MRINFIILVICSASALQPIAAAELDLLVAPKEAPLYRLSNFRTENDQFGNQVMSVDFTRTRQGSGSVSIQGKSAHGDLKIAAPVSTVVDSGTMQLKSLFPNRGQQQIDIEIFFAQTHKWGDGKTRYALVSNAVRLGNPGPASQPRAWTKDEEKAFENYKRIMADDSAQKPHKSYSVSIEVPADYQFVPKDAKIVPGTPLQACYSKKWNPLTTLSENKDGSINVRWDAYGATYDCSMMRDELIIRKTVVQQLRKAPAKPTSPSNQPPELRTWTDATGKFTVRAKLLRKSDAKVTLVTEAGRELTLPVSKLSEADRKFLRSSDAVPGATD